MAPEDIPDTPPHENRLTDERHVNLIRFLKGGLPIEVVARLIGVKATVVTQWRTYSAQGRPAYDGLEEEIQQALAEGEAMNLARITEAGRTNWRAAAWMLEHMYPEKWGPPEPIEDAPPEPINDFADL